MRLTMLDRPRLGSLTIIGFDLQKRLSYNFGSKMDSVKVSQGPDSKFIFYGVTSLIHLKYVSCFSWPPGTNPKPRRGAGTRDRTANQI